MPNTTQNTLFVQSQIRLAELSVFNWGSFHGLHNARIDPQGTLITGDNGAGKSTFIDGLMALLLPPSKASFNVAAAQGDRSDRSLLSYMRGSFGSANDGSQTRTKNKRDKAVITGLRALYQDDDGTQITLVALFWTLQASNSLSDVKRLYLIGKQNIQLKDVLDAFADADSRSLKTWLKLQPQITCLDDRFNDYQQLYRQLLSMQNKNAPALLSRALGLKKIDDLTKLIRELVLEPSSLRDEARLIVAEFADLVSTHDKLLDVREQVAHLERLPQLAQNIDKLREQSHSLEQQKIGLPVYFAQIQAQILSEKLQIIAEKLADIERQIRSNKQAIADSEAQVELYHAQYLQLGGDQIESLRKDITYLQEKLQRMIWDSSRYQKICRELALNEQLAEDVFDGHQRQAEQTLASGAEQKKALQIQFSECYATQKALAEQLSDIQQDITALKARPNSNIDLRYQQLRDKIADELNFADNSLMFIGELIDVAENEQAWQGAIERALGGKRTTLLVPQARYAQVTDWLNQHHTGLFVRAQVVEQGNFSPAEFANNGFLSKLIWRKHPYQHWLQQHLSKSDLTCVNGIDELNRTPFSLTEQGLMQLQKGYFEKKDQHQVNDRRQWQLGFSNEQKLALLNQQHNALQAELKEAENAYKNSQIALETLHSQLELWRKLSEFQWDNINVPYQQHLLASKQQDLARLEDSQGDLAQAKIRWDTAKSGLEQLRSARLTLATEQGSQQQEQTNFTQQLAQAETLMQQGVADDIRALLTKRFGQINAESYREVYREQQQAENELEQDLQRIRERLGSEEKSAVGVMSSFKGKDKWQPLTVDWGVGLDGLADCLRYLDELQQEGLPQLFEQFKQRLNKHTTQSLARLQNQLESEYEKIRDRIARINLVLAKTEFKANSYLRLDAKREKYAHVIAFDRNLKKALGYLTSDNHEERFNLLQELVQILDKASDSATAHSLESLRLLDPRYQMAFKAEEVHSQSGEVLDVLDSSSGKSGGEKESFAGTIVAASLAYVLTPDNGDYPIYSTVFLDEAFSNTAEAVSRRVLRVFKALGIHVNLITPYKNLNLARESARSLLIAERDSEKHESRLCEVTWQQIDEQLAKKQNLAQQAQDLGIELT
ncbi:ATP-binding protein [Lonepinella sp. MS14437]|uniref:ATP-binding protein n=1 Tax=Lonepinella sp. MS14437 TaxID=3003620 RepID=UPI0036D8D49E